MTPVGEALAAEIASQGPVTFHRFMETALYQYRGGNIASAGTTGRVGVQGEPMRTGAKNSEGADDCIR